MKHYQLYNDRIENSLANGKKQIIYFTDETGQIHFRYKINTTSRVRHPGIVVGVDNFDHRWYMHNHYQNDRPILEVEKDFAKGQELYINERQSSFDHIAIIQRGFAEIMKAKVYNTINYNCQTFVNRICFNENKSEAVRNWTGGIAATLLVLIVGNTIFNSK